MKSKFVKDNVLEIAAGSGLQYEYYNWDSIIKYSGEYAND